MYNDQEVAKQDRAIVSLIVAAIIVIIVVIIAFAAITPQYKIYKAEANGRAMLAEARNSKQVQTIEAQANLESEALNAQAEVVRAQGVADAADIEAGKITPEYIQYLWVKKLNLAETQVIYMPTEGGTPVLTRDSVPAAPTE